MWCVDARGDWTFDRIAAELDLSKSAVHRSVIRLQEASLLDGRRRRVIVRNAHDFLLHGFRYVFATRLGAETRGVPTAWAAPPMKGAFAPTSALPPVWPHAMGKLRGAAVEPLDRIVPTVALRNKDLHSALALLDALRLGDARARDVASRMLAERLAA
jgi:hypothetical protein